MQIDSQCRLISKDPKYIHHHKSLKQGLNHTPLHKVKPSIAQDGGPRNPLLSFSPNITDFSLADLNSFNFGVAYIEDHDVGIP